MMHLRIREVREEFAYTQRYVAARLMCDQSLYSKYELGKREIPLCILYKLAELYGTSMDYLAGRTDVSEPYPPAKKKRR